MLALAWLLASLELSDLAPGCENRYSPDAARGSYPHSECRFEFNGVVVDQAGAPVPGVQIKADVSQYGSRLLLIPRGLSMSPAPHDHPAETTDSAGRFRLRSTGYRFELAAERAGYEIEALPPFRLSRWAWTDPAATPTTRKHEVFWSEPAHGVTQPVQVSRDEPFVIHAWKKGEPAYLIESAGYYDEDFRLRTGTTYTLDLARIGDARLRAADDVGDLRLSLRRERREPVPANPVVEQWLLKLEAPGGGVMQTQDPFLYLAPASAYQPSVETPIAVEDQPGDARPRKFYFKSRNGTIYGRIELGLADANDTQGALLRLHYAINPQGERNLLGGTIERPSRFFGRLVDQSGVGIAGQSIAAITAANQDKRVTMLMTGDDGRFEFRGGAGSLGLQITRRRGFAFPRIANFGVRPCSEDDDVALPMPDNQVYWQHVPVAVSAPQIRVERPRFKSRVEPCQMLRNSEAQPYVVEAWRFGPPAELHRLRQRVDFATSDESHLVDLLPTPGRGDLHLGLSAQPREKDGTIRWKLRLETKDGGLQRVAGPFSYEAPASGYAAVDDIEFISGNGADWVHRTYFARLRNGAAYAVFDLDGFWKEDRFAGVNVRGWVNPAGERNLANSDRIEQAASLDPD